MIAVVTGGGGFLGGAIVRRLLDKGWRVRSFSRLRYAELDALGVVCFQGDLSKPGSEAALEKAFAGADVVIHTAAKAGMWGPEEEFRGANVDGTRRVLDAC